MPSTKPSFMVRHRTAIMIVSLLLFVAPLALVLQLSSGDHDFCGNWCPRMFFLWRQGMDGQAMLMGMLRSLFGVALVVGVLGLTLWLGRWWCGFFCPIGGTTELGSRLLPKRWQLDFSRLPAAPLRYGYLSAYFLAPVLGIGSLACNYCNFAAVPRLYGAAMFNPADIAYFMRTAGLINLGLLLLLGFFARGGRAYCNLLCPVGALDALAARFGPRWGKRVRLTSHLCNDCGKCRDVCPTGALKLGEVPKVDQLNCINCRSCEGTCSEGALDYRREEAS